MVVFRKGTILIAAVNDSAARNLAHTVSAALAGRDEVVKLMLIDEVNQRSLGTTQPTTIVLVGSNGEVPWHYDRVSRLIENYLSRNGMKNEESPLIAVNLRVADEIIREHFNTSNSNNLADKIQKTARNIEAERRTRTSLPKDVSTDTHTGGAGKSNAR